MGQRQNCLAVTRPAMTGRPGGRSKWGAKEQRAVSLLLAVCGVSKEQANGRLLLGTPAIRLPITMPQVKAGIVDILFLTQANPGRSMAL